MDLPGDFIIPEGQEELFDVVTCVICNCLILDEIKLSCARPHRRPTCETCFETQASVVDHEVNKKCATCRSDYLDPPRPVDISREAVRKSLRVPCPNRAEISGTYMGCDFWDTLARMAAHLDFCGSIMQNCPYERRGCDKRIPVDYMEIHKSECENRPEDCPYWRNGCNWIGIDVSKLGNHVPTCRYDGILGTEAVGDLGIPIASCKNRIKKKRVQARKIQVRGNYLTVTIDGAEYRHLTEEITAMLADTSPLNLLEEEAIDLLRQAATTARVWISGEEPMFAANEQDGRMVGEMAEIDVDFLLRDSEEEELYSEIEQGMETDNHMSVAVSHQEGGPEGAGALQGEDPPPSPPMEVGESVEGVMEVVDTTNSDHHLQVVDQDAGASIGDAHHAQDVEAEPGDADTQAPLPQGAAVENLAEEIHSLDDMLAFLRQQGMEYHNIDLTEQERQYMEELTGANAPTGQARWASGERRRIANLKVSRAVNEECTICAETGTIFYPGGHKVRHRHFSSRLENLNHDIHDGCITCTTCASSPHLARPTFRRKVILTSSSLRDCFTEAKPEVPEFKGMDGHVDLIAVSGGSVKALAHALLVELKGSDEPIDLCIYGGLNDAMNMNTTQDRDGQWRVNRSQMKEFYRTLARLSAALVNSRLQHTMRLCILKCPPKIMEMGPGALASWKAVNLGLRACNGIWSEKWGVTLPRYLNFQQFGISRKSDGRTNVSYHSYREVDKARKLHLTPKFKLGFAIKICRVWGVGTVPPLFYPNPTPNPPARNSR